jgi:hypothetical protein
MTAMEKSANRSGKRAAARMRAIRRKAAAWQRRARRAVAIALIAASIAEAPTRLAHAQIGQLAGAGGAAGVGQGAMGSVGGLVNGAMQRLGDLDENGPGFMYYGINAADRGLGYRGSYYTVGGFVPYAEDDLGGVWNADLRGHLSNYGGFFSNVGAVRKQFWGGTLFGVGVYWDFDGDQSQYSNTTITDTSGSYTFAGGQTYNQVGVSAEWLTDYGNLRSNGYIPVGNTAQQMGPFVGNSLLCQNGINAGLSGADLEVGAYIPGLADWAGMVSVGGYAFGNARYNNVNGTDLVPYFGGVYTRMDLTLIRNWDFSLQANNDSFFDWTGFARLTYRMGGSRRRNVPDQMEQPMMRNEHVVRAHQAPVQAINPFTSEPWRVIHVDNSYTAATTTSAGTVENPVTNLQEAKLVAGQQFDIIFVQQGNSLNTPYVGGFDFAAPNQMLIGQGSSMKIPTVSCGMIPIWSGSTSSLYPVITGPLNDPAGSAIVLNQNGSRVDHLQIVGSPVGISDGAGDIDGIAYVNDVKITGNGPSQTGVYIQDAQNKNGTYNFSKMQLKGLTADGFVIDGQRGATGFGSARVNITDSTIKQTSGSAVVVNALGEDGDGGRVRLADSVIDGATGPGVTVSGAQATIESTTIRNVGNYGVSVVGGPIIEGLATTGTSTVQVANSNISSTIGIQGSAPAVGDLVNITINGNTLVSPTGGNGVSLAVEEGSINANINSNRITGRATTGLVATGTTISGTVGFQTANILLTTSGTSLTNLTVKAANETNLRAINSDATVAQQPIRTLLTPPPPPNYNPSVVVPLPVP